MNSNLILDIKYLIFIISVLSLDLQAQPSWNLHIIDSSSSGADGVKLADINNDGYPDIVTGWEEGKLTKLYLFPETEKVTEEWPSVIVGNTPSVEDAVFIDMDNDGRLDIVSCTEKNSEIIFIHWAPEKELLNPGKWKQEVLPSSVELMMWMYAEPLQLDGKHGLSNRQQAMVVRATEIHLHSQLPQSVACALFLAKENLEPFRLLSVQMKESHGVNRRYYSMNSGQKIWDSLIWDTHVFLPDRMERW